MRFADISDEPKADFFNRNGSGRPGHPPGSKPCEGAKPDDDQPGNLLTAGMWRLHRINKEAL